MAYLAPVHRPTSVRHALKLELLNPNEQCLVLAKANRLEIYSQREDGLALTHTRSVYGKITMLESIRPVSSATDHLFIGTDRYMYFTVSWDPQRSRLQTEKSYVDQADKTSRDSQTHDRCVVDPLYRFMALFLYDGIVTVLPLSSKAKRKGNSAIDALGDPVPVRVSDLFLRSCVFLHPRERDKDQFKLAFLFEDSHQKVCLSVRALDYSAGVSGDPGSADLENVLGVRDDIELGASHLIPVPAPAHGVLVLAETTISYFEAVDSDPLIELLDEPAQFVAWTAVDESRWLLGDDYGKLYLLMLLLETSGEVSGWKLDAIGKTSRASVLVYLDGGYVLVGSHQGDSQLARIRPGGVEVVQTISNIAPVLDFTIMDMGNRSGEGQTNEYSSGQARIVTGSGIFGDGSLRSVRSGVGLEEQGVLGDMDHATDLFALRSRPTSEYDDVLVVSFVNETRVFRFSTDGDIEEQIDFKSLTLSEGTLLASGLSHGRIIQVTSFAARLIDSENGMVLAEWTDDSRQPITAASANDGCLALAIGGLEIVTFRLTEELQFNAKRRFEDEGQVSCVHVSNINPGVCYIGFWQGAAIGMADVASLQTWKKFVVSDDLVSVPRSMLLVHLLSGESPTLVVAMASGEVITFSVDRTNSLLSSKKITVLGTQQATLKAIPRQDGLSNVFATCEHPSLIYGSEGRIVYSAVTAENATSVCAFNSESYPGAIAIATPEDVRIALVDTERTTHVQTLHVGELVRRIAYSPSLKAFGIGTIHRYLVGTQEIVKSRFKLADEVLFKELDAFDLNEEELVESVIRAELSEGDDDFVERFIVGTTLMDEELGDSIRGRILVFAVTTERTFRLVTELPVKGACRALGCIDGKIIAALVKSVVIYALQSSHLQRLCTYRTSTAPIDLAIHEPTNQIAIADLMKSISVVTYTPPSPKNPSSTTHKLEESPRHFQTAWSTAVAHVGEDTWLESDAEGNLIVLLQDTNSLDADDKRRLRTIAEIRLGEMVNRIRPITPVSPTYSATVPTTKTTTTTTSSSTSLTPPIQPKAFLATVEGGVYLFGLIAPPYLDLLIRLQSALAPRVESLGNMPFMKYRALSTQVKEADEPERFVDGELIEGFLDLDKRMQEMVVAELGSGVVEETVGGLEGLRELVEGLRRLH